MKARVLIAANLELGPVAAHVLKHVAHAPNHPLKAGLKDAMVDLLARTVGEGIDADIAFEVRIGEGVLPFSELAALETEYVQFKKTPLMEHIARLGAISAEIEKDPEAAARYVFPDRPCAPTEPATFDDTSLHPAVKTIEDAQRLEGKEYMEGGSGSPVFNAVRSFLTGEFNQQPVMARINANFFFRDYWDPKGRYFLRHTITPGSKYYAGGSGYPLFDAVRRFVTNELPEHKAIASHFAHRFWNEYWRGEVFGPDAAAPQPGDEVTSSKAFRA